MTAINPKRLRNRNLVSLSSDIVSKLHHTSIFMDLNAIDYASDSSDEDVSIGVSRKVLQRSARAVPRCGLERYGTEIAHLQFLAL